MSNRIRLTDLALRQLKAEGMYWDSTTPAFGVRKGKRRLSFLVVQSGVRTVLGHYPETSVAEARQKAKEILVSRFDVRLKPAGYLDAVERFLKHQAGEVRPRTLYQYGLLLRKFEFTTMAVSAAEIAHALERVETQQAKAHFYAVLKTFFNWAVRHDHVDANPLMKLKKPKVPSPRERVLTDAELVKIWNVCQELGKYGALVRLLMLTGQRKGQFANLRDEWIDHGNKVITFPASVMKTSREHRLPYAYPTDFVLARCEVYKGYYFSPVSALGQPFTAWSKNKAKLDSLVNMDPFVLHDLRRTWSSNAARLGILPHICERVLSHVAPEGKVAAIYNRYRYEDEMRAAQEKMGKLILTLVAEATGPDLLDRWLDERR